MASFTRLKFECKLSRMDGPIEAVELRLRNSSRATEGPPSTADPVAATVVIPTSQFQADPNELQISIARFLSSFYSPSSAVEEIATAVARFVSDRRGKLLVVSDVDCFNVRWTPATAETATATEISVRRPTPPAAAAAEIGLRGGSPPPAAAAEESESEICSICLDELNWGKWEAIEMACGHIFHDFCIYRWLQNYTTCPLCRADLDFEN